MEVTDEQLAEMLWFFDPELRRSFKLTQTADLEADYRSWLGQACIHSTKSVRAVMTRSGGTMFRLECDTCGKPDGQWIKRQNVSKPDMVSVSNVNKHTEFQNRRREQWYDVQRTHLLRQQESGDLEYDKYLASSAWQEKRQRVFARAGGMCDRGIADGVLRQGD